MRPFAKLAVALSSSIFFLSAYAQNATVAAPITRGAIVEGFAARQVLKHGLSTKNVLKGAAIGALIGALAYDTPKTYKTTRNFLALSEDDAEDLIVGPVCVGGAIPGFYPLEYCGKTPASLRPDEKAANDSLIGTPVYSPAPDAHIIYAKDSEILANNMSMAIGGPGDLPPGCDAHHIVPAAESRKWALDDANRSRKVLESCKIDINDAINGVYLPSPRSNRPKPECEGAQHSKVHTKIYYQGLRERLEDAYDDYGCDGEKGVRGILRNYQQDLSAGRIPGPVQP